MANRVSDILQAVSGGNPGALARVTVRTTLTPAITLEPLARGEDGQPVPSGPGEFLNPLRFLKPSFTISTPLGEQTFAPYGEPNADFVPHALGVLVAVAAGTAYLLGRRSLAKQAGLAALGLVAFGEVRRRLA